MDEDVVSFVKGSLLGILICGLMLGAVLMVENAPIKRTHVEEVMDLCMQYELECDVREVP